MGLLKHIPHHNIVLQGLAQAPLVTTIAESHTHRANYLYCKASIIHQHVAYSQNMNWGSRPQDSIQDIIDTAFSVGELNLILTSLTSRVNGMTSESQYKLKLNGTHYAQKAVILNFQETG